MKTALRTFLLVFFMFWLGHSVLPFLTPGGISFRILPLTIISLGLMLGPRAGGGAGFLAGIVESLLTGTPLGCASLSFTLIGWLGGWGARRLNLSAAPALWTLIGALLLLEQWISISAAWLAFGRAYSVGWLDWMATVLIAPVGVWLARLAIRFPRMRADALGERRVAE